MKREKFYRKYEIFVIISTIFTFFFCLMAERGQGYESIYLLPLIYFILFISNKPMHKYSKTHNGMFMLNVILYIKYVVTIFFIVLNKDYGAPAYTGRIPTSESCSQAIIYILIEMVALFITIFIFANKFYKNDKRDENEDEDDSFKPIKVNIVLVAFLIIVGLMAVINFKAFMPTQLFFVDDEYATLKEERVDSLEIIFFSFKTILMGIIINACIIKYQEKRKMRYVIFSYLTILVYVVLNTSTSRINMIAPIIFFVLITNDIFGKKGKILLGITVTILVISLASITVYKSAWLFKDDNYTLLDVGKVVTNQMQEYTSSIRPVAQGIEAIKLYDKHITFDTLMNDIFGSVPIICGLFNSRDRINIYYNLYILGSDTKTSPLIMPLVTISKAYFSFALCYFLSVLNIMLMMYFDAKSSKCQRNYLSIYIMMYLIFVFASSVYGNLQMIVGRVFTRFIPVALILYINNKLIMRKEKHE